MRGYKIKTQKNAGAINHVDLADMPSAINTDHDGRYFTEAELGGTAIDLAGHNHTGGAGAQIDHNDLSNFLVDNHTQYLLIDGTRAMTGDIQFDATVNHSIGDNSDVLEITNPNGDGDVKFVLPVTGDPGDVGYGANSITFSKHDVEIIPGFWVAWNAITPESGRSLLLNDDSVYVGSITSGGYHKYIQFMNAAGTATFGSIHAYELNDTITITGFSGGFSLTGTDLKFLQSTLGVYFGSGGDDGYIIETHTAYSDYRMQFWHDDGRWEFMADANEDLEFRFLGTSNSGKMWWKEDEDYFQFDDDIFLAEGENIIFGTATGTKIGTATTQKIGFFNATPVTQRLKANYNNWAAFTDIIDALVDLGLFDQA